MPPRQFAILSGALVIFCVAFMLLMNLGSESVEEVVEVRGASTSKTAEPSAVASGRIETAPFVEGQQPEEAEVSVTLPALADLHEIEEFRDAGQAWAASGATLSSGLTRPLQGLLAADPTEGRRLLEVLAYDLEDTASLAALLVEEGGTPLRGFEREFCRFADDGQLLAALESGALAVLLEMPFQRLARLPAVEAPDALTGVALVTLARLVAQGSGAATTEAERLLTNGFAPDRRVRRDPLPPSGATTLAKLLPGDARVRVFDRVIAGKPSDGVVRRMLRLLSQPLGKGDPRPLLERFETVGRERPRVRREALGAWLATSGPERVGAGRGLAALGGSLGGDDLFKVLTGRPLAERLRWVNALVTERAEPMQANDRVLVTKLLTRSIVARFDHRALAEDIRAEEVESLLDQVTTPPWGIAVDSLDSVLQLAMGALLKSMHGEPREDLRRGLSQLGVDGLADVLREEPVLATPVTDLLSVLLFLEAFDEDVILTTLRGSEAAGPNGEFGVLVILDRLGGMPSTRREALREPVRGLIRDHPSSQVRCKALELVFADATTHEEIVAILDETVSDRGDDLASFIASGLLDSAKRGVLTSAQVGALMVSELKRMNGQARVAFLDAMEEKLPAVLRSGENGEGLRLMLSEAGLGGQLTGRARQHFDRLLAQLPTSPNGG